MSPQCSEDYRTRRPVSRSNTRRELSEEEKARKQRSYELWKIEQERDRLHEERKKRFIEKYNKNKEMDRHGRTGSREGDNPGLSPEEDMVAHFRDFARSYFRNRANRQRVEQARSPAREINQAPALPPPRSVPRPAGSPRHYDGNGSGSRHNEDRPTSRDRIRSRSRGRPRSRSRHNDEDRPPSNSRIRSPGRPRSRSRRDEDHPPSNSRIRSPGRPRSRSRRNEDHPTSGSRIRSRSPGRPRSHQRHTGGRLTSRNRTRSRSPQHQNPEAGPLASTSREQAERPSQVKNDPKDDLSRRRSHAQPGHDSRGNESARRRDFYWSSARRPHARSESEERRLRGILHHFFGDCNHTWDLSCKLPCPLDSPYCKHEKGCACHRCPKCECVAYACNCERKRRSRPTTTQSPRPETSQATRQETLPASRQVELRAAQPSSMPAPRPGPPPVPPEIRRPPSPEQYPRPIHVRPPPSGRISLYFPMGSQPAHYIETNLESPLHRWWRRYRNTALHGPPPIHIPFLEPYCPIPVRPLILSDGSIWFPPPPPRDPYYPGGPGAAYSWANPNYRNY